MKKTSVFLALLTGLSFSCFAQAQTQEQNHYDAGKHSALQKEIEKVRTFQSTPSSTQNGHVVFYEQSAVSGHASAQPGYQIELYQEPVIAPADAYSSDNTVVNRISDREHIVIKGDTLYSISKRYNVGLSDLKQQNGLAGNNIRIGQILKLRAEASRTVLPQRPQQSSNVVRTVEPIPFSGIYAVLPGDTLYGIAQRACVDVTEIQTRNNMAGSTIHPGQRLAIPAGHCLR